MFRIKSYKLCRFLKKRSSNCYRLCGNFGKMFAMDKQVSGSEMESGWYRLVGEPQDQGCPDFFAWRAKTEMVMDLKFP